jgi:GTP:adenosylcobinamide-phosphate guanylyltransferase
VDAIIIAGGSPDEKDPLHALTGGGLKALLPIRGRPMVSYVIEALAGLREPGLIALYGPDPSAPLGLDHLPDLAGRLLRFPGQGSILENVEHGLEQLKANGATGTHTIVTTGDVPLLQSALLDAHLELCLQTDHDFYFSVVRREIMDTRFPSSQRTYVKLRDGAFCGADVHVLRRSQPIANRALWQRLMASRKHPLRQVAMIGPLPLLKVVTGRMTIAEAEGLFFKLFGARARVIPTPFPELGMDVDRPFQVRIIEMEIERREQTAALAAGQTL